MTIDTDTDIEIIAVSLQLDIKQLMQQLQEQTSIVSREFDDTDMRIVKLCAQAQRQMRNFGECEWKSQWNLYHNSCRRNLVIFFECW